MLHCSVHLSIQFVTTTTNYLTLCVIFSWSYSFVLLWNSAVVIVYGIYASMCWPSNLSKQCDTSTVMVEIEVINKVMYFCREVADKVYS